MHDDISPDEFNTLSSWKGLKARCSTYPAYTDKDIKVCDEWKSDFLMFVKDMGKRPSKGAHIHRIDNDGDYTKENCVWVSHKEHSRAHFPNKKVLVTIKRALYDAVSPVLERDGRTMSGFVRKALNDYLSLHLDSETLLTTDEISARKELNINDTGVVNSSKALR